MYFRYFLIISPWKRVVPSFEQSWIPFTQEFFVPSLVDISSVVLKKKIFLISSMYFHDVNINSHRERAGPFLWWIMNPLHLRMHCAKYGWNWPTGSEEEDFFNFVTIFLLFRNYLPLEKSRALHLNKIESCTPKDDLCQVWLKLAQWFWRRRFF